MLIDLPHVHEDTDRHGNVRIYFWRGMAFIDLDDPDSEDEA